MTEEIFYTGLVLSLCVFVYWISERYCPFDTILVEDREGKIIFIQINFEKDKRVLRNLAKELTKLSYLTN